MAATLLWPKAAPGVAVVKNVPRAQQSRLEYSL